MNRKRSGEPIEAMVPAGVAFWLDRLKLAFARRIGQTTPIQHKAWSIQPSPGTPAQLLLAPTGTGKTWAALLPVLTRWLARDRDADKTETGPFALWISPLRALCSDLARRVPEQVSALTSDVSELQHFTVSSRSADTPAGIRRRDLKTPPSLWIVTPESLAIWLCQPAIRALLANTRMVVVDEVHALASCRRGADLSLSLERLQEITGNRLDRYGLSATCRPHGVAGRFLAGKGRPFEAHAVNDGTPPRLDIEWMPLAGIGGQGEALANRLDRELAIHPTVLLFTRTRATAERLASRLRDLRPALASQIGIHHGSLARDHRRTTEKGMAKGDFRVVVASSSLELGIDIGSVGLVTLVQSPGESVRLLQRVGRSGRGPKATRRGLVLVGTEGELLQATVTCTAGRNQLLEPLRLAAPAEDALCQHLVSEACCGPLDPTRFLSMARRSAIYSRLTTRQFHRCLDYLQGYLGGEKRLAPRLIRTDRGLIPAQGRLKFLLRGWLGTITAAETRLVHLVQSDGFRKLGEVDPGFADQLRPGDRFLLEGRPLQVLRTEGEALEVEENRGPAGSPRWGGSLLPLSPLLAERLHRLHGEAARLLREPEGALFDHLCNHHGLGERESKRLVAHFNQQEAVSQIPTDEFVLVEIHLEDLGPVVCVHTPLPRSANDAVARILGARLGRQSEPDFHEPGIAGDLGFSFHPRQIPKKPAEWIRELLAPERAAEDFAAAFVDSDLVRRRFQELARSGLMLPPTTSRVQAKGAKKRIQVGGNTWGARRLFSQVRRLDPEFPLLVQAMRETQEVFCDCPTALRWLAKASSLPVRVRFLNQPSPFARHWLQKATMPAIPAGSLEERLQLFGERVRQAGG